MPDNPFKFLEAFEKADKDRFFGRNKEIAQLFHAVQASNLVMVYGGSGTGKTSLINCGLANKFNTSDWFPLYIRRQSELNQSLRNAVVNQLRDPSAFEADQPIRHAVRSLYLERFRPVYLIFDQFEELYILGSRQEQKQFHRTVSDLLQAGLQCKILLIIREEYLAYLADFERVVPSLFDNRLRIERMNDRNLAQVITGTCRYGNIRLVEPRRTVLAILDNLRYKREGIDLTNLQVYLDRLWRKDMERRKGDLIDEVSFDPDLVASVGKMENVLSDFVDEQLAEVEQGLRKRKVKNPEGLPLEVLFTLVTDDATKRNMELEEIARALPPNRKMSREQIAYCLQEFQRIRILRHFAEDI